MTSIPASSVGARDSRAWQIAGAAFCALMCALHVAGGLNSGGVADFWRDIYWATVIAHGERFPLSGPPINHVLELGPWWFYVLALPLWLTHRIAFASAFLQLLASAKYVLAWRLGTRAVDSRFGLSLAVGTAIAGWSTSGLWFPSHPALIETTLFLLAFALWRCWDEFSLLNAILYGLAAAACVHAHPTTAMYICAGGLALLYRHRTAHTLLLLGISAAIVLLSLLPPLLDSTPAIPDTQTSLADYARQEVGVDIVGRMPGLLYGLVLGGARMGFLGMTKWSASTGALVWWVFCALLVIAGLGVIQLPQDRRRLRIWLVGAACFLLLQMLFLAIVRPFTSIWMVPSCLPPLALCIAIGWYGWLGGPPSVRRSAGIGLFVLYAALVVMPFGMFLRHLHTMRLMNGNPLMHIDDTGDRFTNATVPFTSVRALDKIARTLCESATLHQRLGAILEASSATAVRNACGGWPDLRFSGMQDHGIHLAGIGAEAALSSGIAPDRVIAGMALYSRMRAIEPADGTSIMGLRRMEVARSPPDFAKPSPNQFEFETAGTDVVALTNRYPLFASLTLRNASVNGLPARQLFSDGRSLLYRCTDCARGTPVHWRLELDGVPANLDIVVLLAKPESRTSAD